MIRMITFEEAKKIAEESAERNLREFCELEDKKEMEVAFNNLTNHFKNNGL